MSNPGLLCGLLGRDSAECQLGSHDGCDAASVGFEFVGFRFDDVAGID